jgi:hypothetical protein
MTFAKVRIDFSTRQYFQPEREFPFESLDIGKCTSLEFPCPNDVFTSLLCGSLPDEPQFSTYIDLLISFPALFFDKLGTVKGMVCHLDLSDTVPVRSRP